MNAGSGGRPYPVDIEWITLAEDATLEEAIRASEDIYDGQIKVARWLEDTARVDVLTEDDRAGLRTCGRLIRALGGDDGRLERIIRAGLEDDRSRDDLRDGADVLRKLADKWRTIRGIGHVMHREMDELKSKVRKP